MTALYLHWPFCKKKCPYCDFNSHVRDAVDYVRWEAALRTELRYAKQLPPKESITSIFFGGGTPSLMPPSLVAGLLEEIAALWSVDAACEITLEANPTSVEAQHFKSYHASGVNRLSLGVQSLIDSELQFLGREHSAKEALAALEIAQSVFSRFNVDLIYARPHQTVQGWRDELTQLVPRLSGHVSLYQLTIEPDTAFARVYAKGGFVLPDAELAAALYEETQSICAQAGLHRYEVSNYAATGQESRHNLSYWRGDAYLGIGPGAHGRYCDGMGVWHATNTIKSPERWLDAVEKNGHGVECDETLSPQARMEEYLLSGLRLTEGIPIDAVQAILNMARCDYYETLGLMIMGKDRIAITERGRILTERIIADIML